MRKILVVSPHADDETLGAGGSLLKWKSQGDKIYWVNFTNVNEKYGYSKNEVSECKEQMRLVSSMYSFENMYDFGYMPAGLHTYDMSELIQQFSFVVKEIQPEIVILPYWEDAHSDHKIVFSVAMTCMKTFRYPFIKKVMCMEIISETDNAICDCAFSPNMYVDIEQYIDKKIDIMKIYDAEWGKSPFPRNENALRGLASYRAAACNCISAEAFRIIKEIE